MIAWLQAPEPEDPEEALDDLYAIATSVRSGPVWLDIPLDVQYGTDR